MSMPGNFTAGGSVMWNDWATLPKVGSTWGCCRSGSAVPAGPSDRRRPQPEVVELHVGAGPGEFDRVEFGSDGFVEIYRHV